MDPKHSPPRALLDVESNPVSPSMAVRCSWAASFMAETLPCVSTALVAETPPLPRASTATELRGRRGLRHAGECMTYSFNPYGQSLLQL